MSAPIAPTVLTLVGGATRTPTRSFPMGNAVSVFSVGAESDWVIVAPGVERVHLYLGFDGREVHVAAAAPTAHVFLNGRNLAEGWHVAPVGCELRFGSVCLLVTNEALRGGTQPIAPLTAPHDFAQPRRQLRTQILSVPAAAGRSEPPPDALDARAPMAGFAPVQPAPRVQGPWGPQAIQQAGSGAPPAPGPRLDSTAMWSTPPGAIGAPPVASALRAENHENQAPPLADIPKIQPAPMVPLGRLDRTLASANAPAQGALPPAVQVFTAGPPLMPMLAPEAPPPVPGATSSNASGAEVDPLGPNTMADGGALRAHAERIAAATPSAAFTSAQAYAEDVRRVTPPTPLPAAGRPAAASLVPPGPAEAAREAPHVVSRFSLGSSWRAASLPKKLTLVLLPFALVGVVVILDDEPAPAPVRVKQVASAPPSASVLAASSTAPSSASAVRAASAPVPGVSGSPPPTARAVGRPSASASPLAGPASSVGTSVIEVGSGAASSAPAPRPLYAAAERDAINAAFEGRNAEAARLYARLASAPESRVFVLAAALARDNLVLKPAISH